MLPDQAEPCEGFLTPNIFLIQCAPAVQHKHLCLAILKQTESSKEQNVQKLDFQFQMKQRRAYRFSFFNIAWSCLIIYAPAVLKLIGPGRWNGCRGYSPSGVKERTGLVSLLLSRLASRLQPWLTLGRGIRLPLADPPPRENTKKRAERKKDKEEQRHWRL